MRTHNTGVVSWNKNAIGEENWKLFHKMDYRRKKSDLCLLLRSKSSISFMHTYENLSNNMEPYQGSLPFTCESRGKENGRETAQDLE